MAKGKTARMDAQGRVILPAHIRKELDLNAGQLVTVTIEGGGVKIYPAEERCCICGETGERPIKIIVGTTEKLICTNCARKIAGIKK